MNIRRASWPALLGRVGGTPLVALRSISAGLPAPIWAKCEQFNLSGSVKDRAVVAMIRDAETSGRLRPGMTIVEPTAGNTGISLALIGRQRGYAVVCVIPPKVNRRKVHLMAKLGAELVHAPDLRADDPGHFQTLAATIARDRHAVQLDQFHNPANVAAHEATTGPEIWQASRGRLSAFVAGAGSAGTITGVGRFLKAREPRIEVVVADPCGSAIAEFIGSGSVRRDGHSCIEGVGWWERPALLDPDRIDTAIVVKDEDAIQMRDRLAREEGLLVGDSAGLAVAAAVELSRRGRHRGGIVALLPDSWDRYSDSPRPAD